MLYIVIGLAGAAGTLLRYGIGVWTESSIDTIFPAGTFICNLAGSFVLGWFYQFALSRRGVPALVRVGIGTGLIGSFTTFSTFSSETLELMRDNHAVIALLYVLLSFCGGLLMAWAGSEAGTNRSETAEKGSERP